MSENAIIVENLSKRYLIGHRAGNEPRSNYTALRDVIAREARNFVRKTATMMRGKQIVHGDQIEEFWALKNLSFEIKSGEAVGIIGRNGAGKSTLLKILSRITEPTVGRVTLRGRVASLLEIGTGFHPELTGRENIFLNGAVLGMTQREIRKKFDEIVAFAEVEKFIDTPVKYYSSGMYVRLAFAVSAHLETEILIVDEVLAVGDAAFQKKCLGKMQGVANEGRTVLFVSHSMATVLALCTKALLLEAGKLVSSGPPQQIVGSFLTSINGSALIPLHQRKDRSGNATAHILSIKIEDTDPSKAINCQSRLCVTLRYGSDGPIRYPRFLVSIYDQTNTGIYLLDSDAVGGLPEVLPPNGTVMCATDPINLTPGSCFVNVALFRAGIMADYVEHASEFRVEEQDVYGSGKVPDRDWVICLIKHDWSLLEA